LKSLHSSTSKKTKEKAQTAIQETKGVWEFLTDESKDYIGIWGKEISDLKNEMNLPPVQFALSKF
jgi:hypothetical protein